MKILLYNDNPVVRKLVALSAQKTKDDLNVIWSIDELDNEMYDLLIVDDALYSDDVMAELKARVPFKSTLMMATRGSSVPAGFDKVIHKPFLPTDLVDLFSQIEKSLSSPSAPDTGLKDTVKAINLEDEMDDLNDTIAIDDLPDLGDLDDEELVSGIKTNILDHEEVQEVQSLLDDDDAFALDAPDVSEDDLFEGVDENLKSAVADDFSDILGDMDASEDTFESDSELLNIKNDDLDVLMNSLEEEVGAEESLELPILEEEIQMTDDASEQEEDFDDLLAGFEEEVLKPSEIDAHAEEIPELDESVFEMDEEEELGEDDLEALSVPVEDEDLLDDQGMDELEQQIQEAVNELDLGELDMALGDEELDELGIEQLGDFEGLEGLEEIDENEMKRAVGESVEEEPEVRIGHSEHTSLNVEALCEAMGDDTGEGLYVKEEESSPSATPSASDGVEALQVLLKTLANEEVVKSLKGMNISININFGNNS